MRPFAPLLAVLVLAFPAGRAVEGAPAPLRVVVTVPDLGDLARGVGGDHVAVTVLVRGAEDPHFVEARPSFVRALHDAHVFVQVGLDLEAGWVPALLGGARNRAVQPGGAGFVDASSAITPLGVPASPVDRSMGDVHARGNPHYLLDPLQGLAVAALLRDRFATLRPEGREAFARGYEDLRRSIGALLVGARLAAKYDAAKLALLHEHGRLGGFLERQGDREALGGWLGATVSFEGAPVAADHDLWPYFARRFGLRVVAFLEPKPGLPPTSAHLEQVVGRMRSEGVKALLAAPYVNPRHAELVASRTGARLARMAHQAGAVAGASTWLETVDWNVRQVAAALGGGR